LLPGPAGAWPRLPDMPRAAAPVVPAQAQPQSQIPIQAQAQPPGTAPPASALPSLVLPPAATAEPPIFASLMRMGDAAMVRGDITRARAMYERAAATVPDSAAAAIAAGKTYDPNILPLFGAPPGLADAARARGWYERARALGDRAADGLLATLR
ncbi:hypothetical protein CKO45_31450, partial [Paracraurococcus ruber]|nr:hypothetical protein [Paracraurococcus ruber]